MASISFMHTFQPFEGLESLFPIELPQPIDSLFSPVLSDPINPTEEFLCDPVEIAELSDKMRISVYCFFLKRKTLIEKGYLPVHDFICENTLSNKLIFRIFGEAIKTLEKLNYERNHKGRITQTEMWSLCPEQIYLKVKKAAIKGKMIVSENLKKISCDYRKIQKFARFDTEEVMAKILKFVLDPNILDPSLKRWLDEKAMSIGRPSTMLKKFHSVCEDSDQFVQKLNAYSLILTMPISQSNITMPLPEVSAKDEVPMATSINSNA